MNQKNSPLMFDLLINFEDLSRAHLTVSGLTDKSQPLMAFCTKGRAIIEGSAMNPVKLIVESLDAEEQVIERGQENPARFSYLSFSRLLSSESEYKQHRQDTDHLMNTMFRIQEMVLAETNIENASTNHSSKINS